MKASFFSFNYCEFYLTKKRVIWCSIYWKEKWLHVTVYLVFYTFWRIQNLKKKWNKKEFSKVTSLKKQIKVEHVKSFPWLKRTSQYHNISNFIVFYFKENMVNGEDKKNVAKCIQFLQRLDFTSETRAAIKLSGILIHAIAFGSCFFFSNFKIFQFISSILLTFLYYHVIHIISVIFPL